MGVHGLWRLLDATGKPVALETLEGKVLAVDVSIWLHQVMQGYQDGRGNPLPNAHLLGLFNRICKLLYYRIKPVFVFDGGVPLLKKNTIASRRKQKSAAASKAQRMKNDLINNILKRTVVKGALGASLNGDKQIDAAETCAGSQPDARASVHSSVDLFKLPVIPARSELLSEDEDDPGSDSDSSTQLSPRKQKKWIGNIHSVDVSSAEFKALPPDVRHDILTDLKATRKQNSWGRLHEMPEESHDFSNYQMRRLLKRRNVQECLEEAEKEMGGKTMTLEELDILLTEQGIATTTRDKTSRIAADNLTRFVYINGMKKDVPTTKEIDKTEGGTNPDPEGKVIDISDDEGVKIVENLKEYEFDEDWDWESGEDQEITVLKSKTLKKLIKSSDVNPAMAYMLEHSGLSQEEILCIIQQNRKKPKGLCEENSNTGSGALAFAIKTEPLDVDEDKSVLSAVDEENSRSSTPSNVSVKSDYSVRDQKDDNSSCRPEEISAQIPSERLTDNHEDRLSSAEEETPVATASGSESDDFVEVEDVPLSVVTSFPKTENCKPALEIAIVPELPLEEDMFADVFQTELVQEKKPTELQRPVEISTESTQVDETPSRAVEQSSVENSSKEKEVVDGNGAVSSERMDQTTAAKLSADSSEENDDRVTASGEKEALRLPVCEEELLDMQARLETEEKELTENLGRLERQATDITDQMRLEAQELLRLFGIPYVIAPMEAEAQCAYLETINLTDGTITDDSDIWLFGGRCVYKNFFNLNKHVLQFRSCDIRHHFKLTREQMVQLALLVGSDYTIGVSGIGPVTALEILGAFPAENGNLLRGLSNFRYWITSGRAAGPGRASLRTKLKNVRVEKGFPSEAVVQAYLAPTVDESREGFTWNKPNATLLADFAREKFGWTRTKFELIFNPIIKRQTEKQKQKGIDSYFPAKSSHKSIEGALSKRVQKAVQRLGDDPVGDTADDPPVPQKRRRKVKPKPGAELGPIVEEEGERKAGGIVEDIGVVGGETPSTSKQTAAVVASEYIPQREKDKANALKKKLRAIEVFRKSKKGPGYMKRRKPSACKIREKAELSESSDSS